MFSTPLLILGWSAKHAVWHLPAWIIHKYADNHFAYPEVMDYIGQTDMMMYFTGLSTNSMLKKQVRPHIGRAKKEYEKNGNKVTLYFTKKHTALNSGSALRQ